MDEPERQLEKPIGAVVEAGGRANSEPRSDDRKNEERNSTNARKGRPGDPDVVLRGEVVLSSVFKR